MKRLIVCVVFVLAAAVLTASPAGAAPSKTDSVFPRGLPHAISENGCAGVARCVWDGGHQGRSYILTRFKGDYLVARVTHRRAYRLQSLWCQRPQVACGYAD